MFDKEHPEFAVAEEPGGRGKSKQSRKKPRQKKRRPAPDEDDVEDEPEGDCFLVDEPVETLAEYEVQGDQFGNNKDGRVDQEQQEGAPLEVTVCEVGIM